MASTLVYVTGALLTVSSWLPLSDRPNQLGQAPRGACADSITTSPASPRRGTLFIVRLRNVAPEATLGGRVSGEPLHFHSAPDGTLSAFAAAPIDSLKSLGVVVTCTIGAATDTLRRMVALSAGSYATEKLRVAPRFGEPPDSALAERLAREGRRAADVSLLAHDTPRMWTRPFVAPRTSRITSRFGGGREFNGAVTSRHMGLDYAGATGAAIRATNRGVVRLVDSFFLGGNVVYIDLCV